MPQVSRNVAANRFEMQQDGLTAVAEYVLEGSSVMRVTHVLVPEPWRGRGIASQLARAVVDFARDENLQVVPQCSFMAAYFARHPEHGDLLARA